jgi:hypothetical protein
MVNSTGVIALAFGAPWELPGNREIARMVFKRQCPIFTQADIQFNKDLPVKDVTYCTEVPGEPPPTLRICREGVKWAVERGYKELWLACARPHLWRAKRDLVRAIKEARADIVVFLCREIKEAKVNWITSASIQPRTKNWFNWYKREVILWFMPFSIYKKVAS